MRGVTSGKVTWTSRQSDTNNFRVLVLNLRENWSYCLPLPQPPPSQLQLISGFAHFVFICYAVARGLYLLSFSSATSFLPLPVVSGPMSRWLFPWSGSIKKRACRYLLQHYLGHFLQERLSLDQLGLDLYNGSGVIKEINLDVWVSFRTRRECNVSWLSIAQPQSSSRVFVELVAVS